MDWEWVNDRLEKPRQIGVTMVIDTGMGLRSFADLLHLAGAHIDFIKLGFGTLALTPPDIVRQKITYAKQHDIWIYPGGTFFEAAFAKGHWRDYLLKLKQFGFTAMEISEGMISLSPHTRRDVIHEASESFLVLAEVGKKTTGSHVTLEEIHRAYELDRAAGAAYTIVEGRESGKDVGIYDQHGELDREFVRDAEALTGPDLIWEAPLKSQQATLINVLGPNVNLGNIRTGDTLAVEALRRGLRADTFQQNLETETTLSN